MILAPTCSGLVIRNATPADARPIAQVHVRSWQRAYEEIFPPTFLASLSVEKREQFWRGVIAKNSLDLLVAMYNDSVVGFVSFGRSRDADAAPRIAELMAIYLEPSSWSKGIGQALWLGCLGQLTRQGFERVTLWVLMNNSRARRFYEAAGFCAEPLSMRSLAIGGVTVEEIRYARPISASTD